VCSDMAMAWVDQWVGYLGWVGSSSVKYDLVIHCLTWMTNYLT